MATQTGTQQPFDDCGSPACGSEYGKDVPDPGVSGDLQTTSNGTCVTCRSYAGGTYGYDYSTSATSGGCVNCKPKSDATPVSLAWNRVAAQDSVASAYPDTWMPGGAGGVFSFLPRVTLNDIPTSGQRVYAKSSPVGTISYDSGNAVQGELPIFAFRTGTTYFTTYDQKAGVYFEYFGGGLSSSDWRYGRINRRYDTKGNVIQYTYSPRVGGTNALLRYLSGDIGGNIVPYFYYANETIDASHFAPITQISLLDQVTPANTRTSYYVYTNETDAGGNVRPFLTQIVNPVNCTNVYTPQTPFPLGDPGDPYQLLQDTDAQGYATQFNYSGGLLATVAEPEGRTTYYQYPSVGATQQIQQGRSPRFVTYNLSSLGDQLTRVTQHTDPLGNTTYYGYNTTLSRIVTQIDPNGNLTYFEYAGGTTNKYALSRRLSLFNGAQTYFGYTTDASGFATYDLAKKVGPRWQAGTNIEVTYYRYDAFRNQTAMVDALGDVTLYGRDALGHLVAQEDARGNTTYFNYGTVGGQISRVDALGNATYYGYNSFLDQTAMVSPRWTEQNFAAFTTYYVYDSLSRRTKTLDPQGNVTYFDYTSRNDLADTVDPLLTETAYTYNGLRQKTIETTTGASGSLLAVTYYGYDTYRNKVRMLDGRGNATYYFYDQNNRQTATVDALQDATYFYYDSIGNRTAATDARANTSYFFYDLLTRNTASRDALGNPTYFFYDLANNPTVQVDALGFATYYFYDAVDRRQATQDALGNPAYFFYDPVGNSSVQMDARFNSTYFGYDADNRRTVTQDALGNSTYYAYNAQGSQTGLTDARNFTSSTFYDTLDRTILTLDALSDPTYFGYDAVGNRTRTMDARFNTTYYFYDGLHRTTATVDALGDPAYFFYDLVGNSTVQMDARFNSTYFGYDALNRQSRIQDALGNSTYYTYDAVGNRSKVIDARSNTSYFFYDALNRTSASADALFNPTYFFYDVVGNRTQVMDARFNTTYYFYDGIRRTSRMRDALGNASYFFYDPVGNTSVRMDARFNSTYFGYDALNRQTQMQDALGNTTYYTYDAVGNRTAIQDARGGVSASAYDGLNRVTVEGDAVGNAVLSQYDPVGNLVATDRGALGYGIQAYGTSPYGGVDGVSTYFVYDAINRLSSSLDPLGNATYYFYDPTSNRTVLRDPRGNATYFGYDSINRPIRLQDATGAATYYAYDAVSNRTRVIDADNHTVYYRFDALNRTSAILYPDSGSAYFFYDPVSNRTSDVDARTNPTYYGYDALNRPLRIQDPLARTVYFQYDPVGNLSAFVDSEGASSSFTYDAINRRTNIAYTPAGAVVADGLKSNPYFVYDQVGNVIQIGDLWGLEQMGYDLSRHLIQKQYPNGNVVYYQYDTRWNVSSRVYPGTSGTSGAAYDSLDRQTQVQAPSGATAYFAYDAASNLTQRLLGDGVKLSATYDAVERVAQWRYANASGGSLSYFDYTRDSKGLITKSFREATYTVYYAYDPCDRLASEIWAKSGATPSEVYGYRYAYDVAGNRTRALANGSATYYFYDASNELTVKGTTSAFASPTYYTYDKNGSLITEVQSGGTTKFAYNSAGLVAKILWNDASATYFYYDGNLQRFGMVAAGTATYFLWDGPNLLQKLNSSGTVVEEYTNAKSPTMGIGQLVETNRPGASPQKIYPVMDPRGTITKYLESDGATVLASREYDAFGTIIPNSGSGTWPGIFGYQGQSWIEITSSNGSQRLLLSPTRIYDPVDGRFISRDPLRLADPKGKPGKNQPWYLYALNNPLTLVDPDGAFLLVWDPGQGWHVYGNPTMSGAVEGVSPFLSEPNMGGLTFVGPSPLTPQFVSSGFSFVGPSPLTAQFVSSGFSFGFSPFTPAAGGAGNYGGIAFAAAGGGAAWALQLAGMLGLLPIGCNYYQQPVCKRPLRFEMRPLGWTVSESEIDYHILIQIDYDPSGDVKCCKYVQFATIDPPYMFGKRSIPRFVVPVDGDRHVDENPWLGDDYKKEGYPDYSNARGYVDAGPNKFVWQDNPGKRGLRPGDYIRLFIQLEGILFDKCDEYKPRYSSSVEFGMEGVWPRMTLKPPSY